MAVESHSSADNTPVVSSTSARDSGWRCAGWAAAVILTSAILGSVLFGIQQHRAPFLLLPLAAGVALGGIGWKAAKGFDIAPGKWLWMTLLVAVVALTAVQHLSAWRHYLAALEQARQKHPQLELIEAAQRPWRPTSLAAYLRLEAEHGRQIGPLRLSAGWTWFSWCFDALLPLPVAIATFRFLERQASGILATRSRL